MEIRMQVNGLDTLAVYPDDTVTGVFLPLLETLSEMHRSTDRRIVVLLAAPPAAGKSTLVNCLATLSAHDPHLVPIQAVGMDGFHHTNAYLASHTAEKDGRVVTLSSIKGAPETFDLPGLASRLERVRSGECVPWPEYDRRIHEPVADTIVVDGDIVLVEGNYLLLDAPGWRELSRLADYTIGISATLDDVRTRLVGRRVGNGMDRVRAESLVEASDIPNARLVLSHSLPADLNLALRADGGFEPVQALENWTK
jgi:hypothetical protein